MIGGVDMLISIFRYVIYFIMQIIIYFILALTQKTTWEVPMNVYASIHSLAMALTIAALVEFVIFVADLRTFCLFSVKEKIVYLIPVLMSFGFVVLFLFRKEGWLFQLNKRVVLSHMLISAPIWGSIMGVVSSVYLMMKRYNLF